MNEGLVRIYDAATVAEARLLVDRLEQQGIRASLDNATSPLAGLTAAEQTVAVRVLASDEPRARALAARFEREGDGPSP